MTKSKRYTRYAFGIGLLLFLGLATTTAGLFLLKSSLSAHHERILERTIIAATGLDYPNFRVWVLDDGRRPWLKDLCRELGAGYVTREENVHGKAGNINHALRLLGDLAKPPEYIAILDADFVATEAFLARAMSLFHDPTVGIVQTPQHFLNPDPIQTNLALTGIWPAYCCGVTAIQARLRRSGAV